MKKKTIYGITTVLAISLLTGCGAAKLKNGEELVAKVDNYKISADDLYSEMKEKYAVKTLIDNIDHQLLDTTYKTDETETKAIENQIEEIKKTYGSNDQIFEQIIKQIFLSLIFFFRNNDFSLLPFPIHITSNKKIKKNLYLYRV